MGKIYLKKELVKHSFEQSSEFESIEDFCDFLDKGKKEINVKVSLRKFFSKEILKENSELKKELKIEGTEDRIKWLRENCLMEGEVERNKEELQVKDVLQPTEEEEHLSSHSEPVIPQTDFEKIRTLYEEEEYKKVRLLDGDDLDYTDGIVLKEGGIITQKDQFYLFLSGEYCFEPDLSKILMVEEEGNRVLALGYLEKKDDRTFTVLFSDKACIQYQYFEGIKKARLILYSKNGEIFGREIEFSYEPYNVEEERPLCIDFGTSNTSAGSYGILERKKDEAEIVRFIDVSVVPNNKDATLLPTLVYVEDCSDENNINYLFGFEARKRIEEEHYESKASVYYEIKRWMASPEIEEEIRDNHNNKARPKRIDIITAYIDYVIECAEQFFGTRFRKLHFSAPVKMKTQFIQIFSEHYKKKERFVLDAEESIDEGIAIVYNQIIRIMDLSKGEEQKKRSIMIMDCGGGTTDLASCEFDYKETAAGIELSMDTCFENGNSNFGGNNITYRIMQLLKIKIAEKYSEGLIDDEGDAIRLIEKEDDEILGLIEAGEYKNSYNSDEENHEVYGKFLKNYEKAEQIIPTKYVDNPIHRGSESLKKIKRNFHYLWKQAEQIKIEFFKSERVLMNFDDATENIISKIKSEDNYYLYITEGSLLKKVENPFEKVEITINEINRVIRGDIFSLLVGLFGNGISKADMMEVDKFDYYKLSGQSCRISMFSELIKEYIPGRKLRPAFKSGEGLRNRNSENLKLDCVIGCIHYVKDQIRPEMKVVTINHYPEIVFDVELKREHAENKKLFNRENLDKIILEVNHTNTREMALMVLEKGKEFEKEFIFNLRNTGEHGFIDEIWTTEEIKNKILKYSILSEKTVDDFIDELTDIKKGEDVNVIFVIPAKQGYGMYICQIRVHFAEDKTEYYVLAFKYETFEDSSKTFFNGQR